MPAQNFLPRALIAFAMASSEVTSIDKSISHYTHEVLHGLSFLPFLLLQYISPAFHDPNSIPRAFCGTFL